MKKKEKVLVSDHDIPNTEIIDNFSQGNDITIYEEDEEVEEDDHLVIETEDEEYEDDDLSLSEIVNNQI